MQIKLDNFLFNLLLDLRNSDCSILKEEDRKNTLRINIKFKFD